MQNNDSDSTKSDNLSDQSIKSNISFNPDFHKIMENKNVVSDKSSKNKKKTSLSGDNTGHPSRHAPLDEISFENITIGSIKRRKKKPRVIELSSKN